MPEDPASHKARIASLEHQLLEEIESKEQALLKIESERKARKQAEGALVRLALLLARVMAGV